MKGRKKPLGNTELSCITAVTLLVLLPFSVLIPDLTVGDGPGKVELVEWSIVTFFWFLFYFIASARLWRTVQPDEVAVRIRLGKPISVVTSGFVFAPLWIYTIQYIDIKVIQKEFPAEPEKVFEGDLNERVLLPSGMKPAIRITFNDSIEKKDIEDTFGFDATTIILNRLEIESWCNLSRAELEELEEKYVEKSTGADGKVSINIKRPDLVVSFSATQGDDGLHRRLTTQVTPVILWKILDPITFITRVGSIETANQWIEDDMVSILQRILPHMSVAQAMDNVGWINAHLLFSVTKRMANAGVRIENAYLKRIPLHHSLNTEISARAAAFYTGSGEAEKIRLKGAAEADMIALTGTAKAAAARQLEEETLSGRAVGMKKMAEDLGVSGADVQAAEVARAVADGGNTIVVGTDGFTQIAGIAAAMKSGQKKSDPTAPKPSDGPEET